MVQEEKRRRLGGKWKNTEPPSPLTTEGLQSRTSRQFGEGVAQMARGSQKSNVESDPMFFTDGLPSAANAEAYAARLNPMLSSGNLTGEMQLVGEIFDLIRQNDEDWKKILQVYEQYVADNPSLDQNLWKKGKGELFSFNFAILREKGKASTLAAVLDYIYYGIEHENIVEKIEGSDGLRSKQAQALQATIKNNFVLFRDAVTQYQGAALSDPDRKKYLELVNTLIAKLETLVTSLSDADIQVRIEHLGNIPPYRKGTVNPHLPSLKQLIKDAHAYDTRVMPIASGLAALAAPEDQQSLGERIGFIFKGAFDADDYRTNCEMWTKILELGRQSQEIQDRAYYLLVRDLRQLQRELDEMDAFVKGKPDALAKLEGAAKKGLTNGLQAWKKKVDELCAAVKEYPTTELPAETAFAKALKDHPPIAVAAVAPAEAAAVVEAPVVEVAVTTAELAPTVLQQPPAPAQVASTAGSAAQQAATPAEPEPTAASAAQPEVAEPAAAATIDPAAVAVAATAAVAVAAVPTESPKPETPAAAPVASAHVAPVAATPKPAVARRAGLGEVKGKVPVIPSRRRPAAASQPTAAPQASAPTTSTLAVAAVAATAVTQAEADRQQAEWQEMLEGQRVQDEADAARRAKEATQHKALLGWRRYEAIKAHQKAGDALWVDELSARQRRERAREDLLAALDEPAQRRTEHGWSERLLASIPSHLHEDDAAAISDAAKALVSYLNTPVYDARTDTSYTPLQDIIGNNQAIFVEGNISSEKLDHMVADSVDFIRPILGRMEHADPRSFEGMKSLRQDLDILENYIVSNAHWIANGEKQENLTQPLLSTPLLDTASDYFHAVRKALTNAEMDMRPRVADGSRAEVPAR